MQLQSHDPKKKKPQMNPLETGRYEVQPPPDKPEQAREVRPDLEAMETEKGATSRIDTAYAGTVSKFFNEKRKVANVTDAQDTQYFDHDAFLAMEQQSLEKLANPEAAKALKPKDVAMAVGDLAGEMAGSSQDRAGNRTGDPAVDAENGRANAEAKKVFMMAGEKAYPHVTIDTANFGVDLERTSRILREASDASFIPDMSPGDLQKMYDEDPKALAKKLDVILGKSGDLMRMRSRINFDNKDPKRQEEANAHLAAGGEMFYKMQLMRDALQEKTYGRKDVTPEEAKQIDASRAAFSGQEAPKEEEPAADDSVKRLVEKAEKSDVKDPAKNPVPALEAMRGVWKKPDAFANRLAALSERVKTMADLKLEDDDKPVSAEFARRASILQAYGDLMPAERRALAEAAQQEFERAKQEGGADALPPSAERQFSALMDALR
jgi:hypothetical protein